MVCCIKLLRKESDTATADGNSLKLNSYSNTSIFFNAERWAVASPFRLKRHCLAKNAHVERFQITNRIMCHEREMLLKLNFFQLTEGHHSWSSVLISIYWLDAHDLKNWNDMRMQESDEKTLCIRVWIQLYITYCEWKFFLKTLFNKHIGLLQVPHIRQGYHILPN